MTTFIAYGEDILQNANATTLAGGQDGAGQVSIAGGTQLFATGSVVVFTTNNVAADGEFSGSSAITQITVYATQSDYGAGTVLYDYTPQNPGQTAGVQTSADRMGDTYLRFGASNLTSSSSGAPSLQDLFVAPGSSVATSGGMTFNRNTDVDYDESGGIGTGTIEDGNGFFNLASTETVCFTTGTYIATPQGPRRIETLGVGDYVQTADNGAQPLIWIGRRTFSRAQLVAKANLRPVLIPAGTHGATAPTLLSRQHAIVTPSDALVPAVKLMRQRRSRMRVANGLRGVTYLHVMCEKHEVVFANGIAAETFYPGPQALRMLRPGDLSAVLALFPTLKSAAQGPLAGYGERARPLGCVQLLE